MKKLPVKGQFSATIHFSSASITSLVYVIAGDFGCLLSHQTASALGLIKVNVNHIHHEHTTYEQLTKEYAHIFDGIGTLKDHKVTLHIDKSITPVFQQPCMPYRIAPLW